MVHVHSDQVGVVIIHPKAVKTNFSSWKVLEWTAEQTIDPETTGTFVLTRQDHIWRGLKAQKQLMGSLLIKSLLKSNSGISRPAKLVRWEMPVNCKPWICCKKVGRFGAIDLVEPQNSMAKSQKKWCDFQTDKWFLTCFVFTMSWENVPSCQIVFTWRLKPSNSDTSVSHSQYIYIWTIWIFVYLCFLSVWTMYTYIYTYVYMPPHPSIFWYVIFDYLHASYIMYIHIMLVLIYLQICMWIYLYTYTYILLLSFIPIINKFIMKTYSTL